MPHVIMGTSAHTRMASAEYTLETAQRFFWPISRGEPLTPAVLSNTPNPFFVIPPEKGEMPEIFGEQLGAWTINENVKKIIEMLEPDVHTFIPVKLQVRGKSTDFGKYFVLVIGQVIDAVVIEDSDFRDGHGRAGFEKAPILNSLVGDTVLNHSLIKGRHLWRGGNAKVGPIGDQGDPFASYTFCSDELKDRLKAAKVEGWRFRQCKVSK